jgi:hypothetical protein
MNNLSYPKDFGKTVESVEIISNEVNDDRVIISIENDGNFGHFLASEGKPFVFANEEAAEEFAKEHALENYNIEPFVDYDFSGIELIEL